MVANLNMLTKLSTSGGLSNVVDALDVKNSGNPFHAAENSFKLFAIVNIQRYFDPRAKILASALECTNICARITDHGGNSREYPRPVFRENAQPHREGSLGFSCPLHWNPPLRFIKQILNIWTNFTVHCNAAPARDISHNVVARNRIATF